MRRTLASIVLLLILPSSVGAQSVFDLFYEQTKSVRPLTEPSDQVVNFVIDEMWKVAGDRHQRGDAR